MAVYRAESSHSQPLRRHGTAPPYPEVRDQSAGLARSGFEDRFRVGGPRAVTDPDATIGTDEDVPVLHPKAEKGIGIGCAVVALEQAIDGIGIDELVQRREFEWIDPGRLRQGVDYRFRGRPLTPRAVLGIDDRRTPAVECEFPVLHSGYRYRSIIRVPWEGFTTAVTTIETLSEFANHLPPGIGVGSTDSITTRTLLV